MKAIAIMPVRNAAWILPTTLGQLRRFADEIVALDGASQDETRELIEQAGGAVLPQADARPDYSGWRQQLLEEGRRRGGTHFIWLDADEAFTTNFLASFKNRLSDLRPGDKLVLDWLCLWKDARRFRRDQSVWSSLKKDFVFCDDGVSSFGRVRLHEGRTPGANAADRLRAVPREEGAVLHFQFVPFHAFQVKQSFLRCLEWTLGTARAWQINEKYGITLDDPTAVTEPIPPAWLAGLAGLDALASQDAPYYKEAIFDYFKQRRPSFFEPLEIWHVPEFHERFVAVEGREPRPAQAPPALSRLAVRALDKWKRLRARSERPHGG